MYIGDAPLSTEFTKECAYVQQVWHACTVTVSYTHLTLPTIA